MQIYIFALHFISHIMRYEIQTIHALPAQSLQSAIRSLEFGKEFKNKSKQAEWNDRFECSKKKGKKSLMVRVFWKNNN